MYRDSGTYVTGIPPKIVVRGDLDNRGTRRGTGAPSGRKAPAGSWPWHQERL